MEAGVDARARRRRERPRLSSLRNLADQEMNEKMNQEAWCNPVKKKLRAGQPVLAITITVNSIDVAAHAARMGFDFLWIEMEHSPITLETRRNMALATRGVPALPV